MMNFDPNGLYYQMVEYFNLHKNDQDKVIFCNEGSSRSSKTWDLIHFVVTYCDHNRGKSKDIYFLRDSLVNCRDFLLKEVEKCFRVIGIPFTPTLYPKPYFNLWGNNIYFRGLDDEMSMEGFPSHIAFINEALDIPSFDMISGILMRCEEVFAADWNPKYSDHFMFSFEKRPNCLFTHSTYRNNKHLPATVVREIESYNPEIPENVANGTANPYRWQVYGLGQRASHEGLVFPDVTWINEFPADVEEVAYGMDFGHTNSPTVIVKAGRSGRDLYLEKLFYGFTDDPATLAEVCRRHLGPDNHIWADSAEPGMIADLRLKGIVCLAVKKYNGSKTYGIDLMKQYRIHIVRDPDFRREAENYAYKVVQGIRLNEPEKKHDHIFDGARYACMSEFRTREDDQYYFIDKIEVPGMFGRR